MRSIQKQAFSVSVTIALTVLVLLNAAVAFTFHTIPSDILVLSCIILIVALLLSYWYSKRLVKPIIDLVPQDESLANERLVVSNHGDGEIPEEIKYLSEAIDQIREKQRASLAAMQKLERVRSEFLGNVSHELRTPIFAVQGFIETLLDGALEDPSVNRDFLSRAQTQAGRLNNLLNDLIDISRIESGEMRMSFRIFDIQPLIRELVRDMQPLAANKSIELYVTGNIRTHHEVGVYGDKERLKQVLINLIDNAIKYTTDRGVVKVEVFENEPNPEMVTVRVQDTGVGIAQEHLPRIFERFYRVDKDRARSSPGGTGLGLAIVKHIIEAHAGQIFVTSELEKGSTFSFTLHKHPLPERL